MEGSGGQWGGQGVAGTTQRPHPLEAGLPAINDVMLEACIAFRWDCGGQLQMRLHRSGDRTGLM